MTELRDLIEPKNQKVKQQRFLANVYGDVADEMRQAAHMENLNQTDFVIALFRFWQSKEKKPGPTPISGRSR